MQRFAFVLAFSLAGTSSLARADFTPSHLVRTGMGPVCAMANGCSHATDCTSPETCTSVTNTTGVSGMVCLRDTATEIFCCSTAADCPNTDTSVRCVHQPTSTGGSTIGLCAYADRSYCLVDPTMLGVGEIDRFIACHTPAIDPCRGPVTTVLTDFDNGDCDGDGVSNGSDSAPCMAMPIDCVDAGLPDGGADAGPDLGTIDAGAPDLGSTGMDAAAPAPPGVSFRGGAGCTCRVGGGASGTGALATLVALAALVAARRRRHGQR